MTSLSRGGMQYLFRQESMGGNAATWGPYPCVGLNFCYDPNDGKIELFSNNQPRKIDHSKHYFRAAVKLDSDNKFKLRIIDFFTPKEASKKAKINLTLSVKEYNKIFAFKLTYTEKARSIFW